MFITHSGAIGQYDRGAWIRFQQFRGARASRAPSAQSKPDRLAGQPHWSGAAVAALPLKAKPH